jgi:hypothetical protein
MRAARSAVFLSRASRSSVASARSAGARFLFVTPSPPLRLRRRDRCGASTSRAHSAARAKPRQRHHASQMRQRQSVLRADATSVSLTPVLYGQPSLSWPTNESKRPAGDRRSVRNAPTRRRRLRLTGEACGAADRHDQRTSAHDQSSCHAQEGREARSACPASGRTGPHDHHQGEAHDAQDRCAPMCPAPDDERRRSEPPSRSALAPPEPRSARAARPLRPVARDAAAIPATSAGTSSSRRAASSTRAAALRG